MKLNIFLNIISVIPLTASFGCILFFILLLFQSQNISLPIADQNKLKQDSLIYGAIFFVIGIIILSFGNSINF